ncbi:hypothetical protein [Chryseobacterium sp. IT-36CA2]|uniref:hypothetical protein n=1 Tax=Chryseobacterium sp. IT-36CA2 TaxID=3026460 RepID=UPI0039E17EE7
MKIHIKYKNSLDNSEVDAISEFTKRYGELTLSKKSGGSGSIDLVSFIEFSLGGYLINYLAKPIFESYNKGLINEEYFQKLGTDHRKKIIDKTSKIFPYFNGLYLNFLNSKKDQQESISLVENFENFSLYVSLNEKRMTEELLNQFPEALCNTYSIISLRLLELDEPHIVQLYPNFETQTWDYLFMPTVDGFGKFIDKYYSFSENKIHYLATADEFIQKFNITDLSEYKLIINPRS